MSLTTGVAARRDGERARLALSASFVLLAGLLLLGCAGSAGGPNAPGRPGAPASWTPANKAGFGTAYGEASKVWFTLGSTGELTEVYYPTLGTPSVRELRFVVSDGLSSPSWSRRPPSTASSWPTRAALPSVR